MKLRWRRKVLQLNDFSPPFGALAAPPSADYRGIPTLQCPCGCAFQLIATVFDPDTREPGMYLLDARCAACGAWITAPTPVDDIDG